MAAFRLSLLLLLLLLLASPLLPGCRPTPSLSSQPPLTHAVYVWQRVATPAVRAAVASQGPTFDHVNFLAAELEWDGPSARLILPSLPWEELPALPSVGLSLRIGPLPGESLSTDPTDHRFAQILAAVDAVLAQAHQHHLPLASLDFQIDFDAAESQLAAYTAWLHALRPHLSPSSLSFTALPSWLKHRRAFAALAASADHYVLQVHALELPRRHQDPVTLCDPAAALRAVRRAARFNHPFHLALPTYGHGLVYRADGTFHALLSEVPPHRLPPDALLREVSAHPAELASLVRTLSHQRPPALQGLIWFRLPVSSDTRNWPPATLAAVRRGDTPAPRLQAQSRPSPSDPLLLELFLQNHGDATHHGPLTLQLNPLDPAKLLARDALPPFQFTTPATLATSAFILAPDAEHLVAWLRFTSAPPSFDVQLSTP